MKDSLQRYNTSQSEQSREPHPNTYSIYVPSSLNKERSCGSPSRTDLDYERRLVLHFGLVYVSSQQKGKFMPEPENARTAVDQVATVGASLEEAAINEFRAGLRGELLRPGESGFDAARRVCGLELGGTGREAGA